MKLIQLGQGKCAKVDDSDFEWLNQLKWSLKIDSKNPDKFYAFRMARMGHSRKHILMHRFILGMFDSQIQCDHWNGDSIDNQRDNLRAASARQNAFNTGSRKNNTSGFRGVALHKVTGKWRAQIRVGSVNKWLGLFDSPESASLAYEAAAREAHGEFYHEPHRIQEAQTNPHA